MDLKKNKMTSTDDIISADRPGLKSGVDFRGLV